MESVPALLAEQRRETLERLASLTRDFDAVVAASVDSNADDEHDPEGATIAFERSQLDGFLQQERRHLEEISAAQRRWDTGTYGTCSACGSPIDPRRLEAMPVATTCIRCASESRG